MPIPGTTGSNREFGQSAVLVGVDLAPVSTGTSSAQDAQTSFITMNTGQGVITSPNLTTNVAYSLIVTNSVVSATDIVWVSVQNGTNTATVFLSTGLATVKNGTFSVVLNNINTAAHNGTVQICFQVLKMVAATPTSVD